MKLTTLECINILEETCHNKIYSPWHFSFSVYNKALFVIVNHNNNGHCVENGYSINTDALHWYSLKIHENNSQRHFKKIEAKYITLTDK